MKDLKSKTQHQNGCIIVRQHHSIQNNSTDLNLNQSTYLSVLTTTPMPIGSGVPLSKFPLMLQRDPPFMSCSTIKMYASLALFFGNPLTLFHASHFFLPTTSIIQGFAIFTSPTVPCLYRQYSVSCWSWSNNVSDLDARAAYAAEKKRDKQSTNKTTNTSEVCDTSSKSSSETSRGSSPLSIIDSSSISIMVVSVCQCGVR